MPKIPAVPGTLKRAYSQSRLPKPREYYGNDLLGFAADRWSRINKVPEDLQALDDYAVQRRAYGGYSPEALNEMKMSILAARADAARDFDRGDRGLVPLSELADVYDYSIPFEMDELSYPGTGMYLDTGIPEEGDLPRRFVDEANDDLRTWYYANERPRGIPSKNFKDYETLDWDDYKYYR